MEYVPCNKRLLAAALLICTALFGCKQTEDAEPPAEWENPEIFAVNKEEPRAHG